MMTDGAARRGLRLAALVLALGCGWAGGQEVSGDEVYELSPFQVTASDELGYAARATTGGVRLRTDLRDLGAQVDVLSLEFLQDVGALEPEEAFLYSINVENEQENPNYVADDGNANNFERRTAGVTARGFGGGTASGATQARDYFTTNLGLHGYNTGSVVVSSGPNAILFGLGKPGGVVNLALNQAELHKTGGRAQLRLDNWGSRVVTGDYNQVLIPDRLAVRLAILDEEEESFFKPNFKDQERYYGTLTLRPHRTLRLRLHYEDISIVETPDQWILPNDDVTPYLERGQTTSGFHQNRAVFDFGDDEQLDQIWPNYTKQTIGEELVDSELNQPGSPLDPGLDRFKYTLTPELLDRYGWPYDRVNLWGTTQRRLTDADILTAVAEWNPLRDLHFEFGYNRERFTGRQVAYGRSARYRMSVDTAATLPDGRANPNLGRFFVGDTPWGYQSVNREEEFRVTAAYELDLAGRYADGHRLLNALLGRHQFAALYSDREATDIRQLSWRTWNDIDGQPGIPPPFITNANAYANAAFSNNYLLNNVRGVSIIQYVDPGGRTPYMREIPGWDPAEDIWEYEQDGMIYRATQFDPVIGGFRPAESSLLEIQGSMLAWQGKFWNDRIILTYGYREDAVRTFRFKTTASPDLQDGETASNSRLQGGNWAWYTDVAFSSIPEIDDTYRNDTRGIVLHPTGLLGGRLDWLSLFYNESTNNDAGLTSLGPAGRPNPAQTGVGRDFGFMVNTAEGRLSVRVNWFETSLENEETSAFGLVGRIYNLEERIEEVDPLGYAPAADGFDVRTTGRNQVAALQDSVSEGMELSLVASPTPNWDVRLTVAKLQKVSTNIGAEWLRWLDDRIRDYAAAEWYDLNDPAVAVTVWDRVAGEIFTAAQVPGAVLTGWDNIAYKDGQYAADDDSIKDYYDEQVAGDVIPIIGASNGLQDRNVRKWRGNLTVSYSFTDGPLDGLRIGGSVRYRDRPAIGYPLVAVGSSGTVLPDLDNPYFGDREVFYDAIVAYELRQAWFGASYRLQLNVRNLADNSGPYARRTDSQGVARVYGYHEPRSFLFTLTVKF